jgi:hypothetical protein
MLTIFTNTESADDTYNSQEKHERKQIGLTVTI